MRLRTIAAATALVVACAVSVASGGSNTPSAVEGGSANPTGNVTTYKIGQTVKLGDWQVKVISAKNPYKSTNQFEKPAAGSKYVTTDVQVTNNSNKAGVVSSMACFKMRDGTGQEYNEAIVTGVPKPPDGDVAPGQTVRGTLSYEVPTSAKGLLLVFNCDLFSSGSANIAIP